MGLFDSIASATVSVSENIFGTPESRNRRRELRNDRREERHDWKLDRQTKRNRNRRDRRDARAGRQANRLANGQGTVEVLGAIGDIKARSNQSAEMFWGVAPGQTSGGALQGIGMGAPAGPGWGIQPTPPPGGGYPPAQGDDLDPVVVVGGLGAAALLAGLLVWAVSR